MKRISILILAIIVSAPLGFAQEKTKKEKQKNQLPTPYVEVWGGMGLSTVAGSLSSTEGRLSGLFGAGFTLPISQKNNLHFEGSYSFQGFKYTPQTYQVNDTTTVDLKEAEQRFNYFTLTVMDRYFLDKKRTFYVNGGFYVSYLAQARFQANYEVEIEGQWENELREIDDDNMDAFTAADFGLTGGIGVRLGNKQSSNFTIEARAAYGLINVAKARGGESFNEKNLYGVLKLGVDIPVKN